MKTILHINASGRREGSVSRQLSGELVGRLKTLHPDASVIRRDADADVGLPDNAWVAANFTPAEERSASQQQRPALSDMLTREVLDADHIVIGTPIYNFTVPAALKAWIDQICRPGPTFRAEPDRFVGLATGKKAYVVSASGGTEIQGPIDFATNYLIHILGFIGIDDVAVIPAHHLLTDQDGVMRRARPDRGDRLELFPNRRKHPFDKEMRRTKRSSVHPDHI